MPQPPPTVPYSSGHLVQRGPQFGGRTVIAAGLCLFLLWCFYTAFWQFTSDQIGLFFWGDRAMVAVGYEMKDPTANTVAFFWQGPSNLQFLDINVPNFQTLLSVNGLPFAAAFGLFLPAVIFQMRVTKIRWLAAAVPIAAGLWRYMALFADSVGTTAPAIAAQAIRFGAPPTPTTSAPLAYFLLAIAVVAQAATVFIAAMFARRFATWAAGVLLPYPQAAALRELWMDR